MFGYVVVNKPELKIREFEVYQSFYCGLCDALHKAYGRKGQLTLNFDLTFVAILLNGLYEPVTTTTTKRCIVHPLHPHLMVENDAIRYAADMTILLTILKCEDDWLDEHRRSAQAMQALSLIHIYDLRRYRCG